jgi:hypothetical protein
MAILSELLLSGDYTLALRALVMAGNLSDVLAEVPADVLDGSVDMDRHRQVRRRGRIVLDNSAGGYTPEDAASLTWPNRIWRLERGAYVDGTPQYVTLMTGLLNEPRQAVRDQTIPFTLEGRLTLANQQFSAALVLVSGTRLADAVRTIAELAGLGTDDALYVLDDGGRSLVADRAFDVADNMLDALHKLASDNALDLFDDALGRTCLAPWSDPSTVEPAWTFDATSDALTLDVSRTLRGQQTIYNRANVTGVAPDRYPIEAEARDLNPNSPTYNPLDGSGPIGDRPRPRYVSADIHDQAAANEVALRLLYEGALFEESIATSAVPLPGVEDRQVVRIVGAGANDSYLLDSVSIPLRGGTMRLATRRVRSLIAP